VIGGAAVVGCGLIGRKRAQTLEARGVRVRSVYDVSRDAAEALAANLPSAVVAASASDAFVEPGVDLAVIATSHVSLAPLASEAVRAGLHVLVEKPGGHHLSEVEALAEEARRLNRVVRVGFNHRFHPALRKAHEIVAGGALGPVLHVRGRYGHGGRLGYEREWRADPVQSGGGELLDQGVHLIDLTRFLVGPVELAFCELRTEFWHMPVEDNAYLALRSSSGAFAWLHASWTEWRNLFSLEIAMRTGKVEIQGLGGSYGVERLTLHEMLPDMGPPVTSAWEWPRGDASWADEVDDVLAAIDGRAAVGASLDDCIDAFRVIDEAYAR
jgi:predicted dehydrogenase